MKAAQFPAGVPGGPGEVVAEPVPLRLGQVLDQAKDGGATAGQNAAPLIFADATYRIGIGHGWDDSQKGGAEHVRAVY